MPASTYEQEWAQTERRDDPHLERADGARGADGAVAGVRLRDSARDDGSLQETGERWSSPADMVFKAIGQTLVLADPTLATPARCAAAASWSTPKAAPSLPGVWAGGDCALGGRDLTVEAVEDGKLARAVDRRDARRHLARRAGTHLRTAA